ncbi:VOC family protein [Mycolicibacterium brumae]|uniref:VOC family protein n=1 Tax=Mycolicibacterium brumae TaxID=85968 RepID=A0A2G5P7Y5_9MYCO|nr:VOC family protein [Mycolicibacterium brumae]MCV7194058.1 VOC family protein [Mycolicibacterium brumae]PIB74376.1 VOC family protein [Mycolicibacterium brumae]RWA22770.1 hypothetical protein MBRU_12560 [Mycolicibacterium brumae DSM 44177]UWW07426.1 VOC family protein [Mycolicibacterium brumae]
MALGVEMITFDTCDPDRLAGWWADAVGGTLIPVVPGGFVIVALASGQRLGFQQVDDPTPGKNRVHLDLGAEPGVDLETQVGRLLELGAVETARHSFGEDFSWVVFADPDGNAFCLSAGS